ncbi:hypothetical protein DPX16_11321 [Anabarilius grahami]|uniref:Uncharacterized protein n=1 Tax=Anabarilius grahami TaxID=495550 RepID=A0A3N0XID6_ANAGA|nr:hypothetical protein DPX16_11321 [Anabarilius grahami]
MLSSVIILNLVLHTCLSELDMLHPSQPCTEAENKNGYNTFLKRHVRKDIPTDLKEKNWKMFINKIGTWNRPIQSFFSFSEKNNVTAVCSSGGKMYKDNLCISKNTFSFITVNIDSKKKKVKSVKRQKQHVILACDKFKNKCLPDHFQANTKKDKPNNNKPDCSKLTISSIYEEEVFSWL